MNDDEPVEDWVLCWGGKVVAHYIDGKPVCHDGGCARNCATT